MRNEIANLGGETSLFEENVALRAELEALRAQLGHLEHLADMDPLVPLPNRRAFIRDLERVISSADRYGSSNAVIFADLHGLKPINDNEGHRAGDAVLCHVARLLRSSIRGADYVARIGGDEFGLILQQVTVHAALAKAKALEDFVAASPIDLGNVKLPVRISCGLAMIDAGDDAASVLDRADAAMYAARARDGLLSRRDAKVA